MSPPDQRDRLTQLYQRHWRELFAYALRRCPTSTDAAEVVSEVFLTAWRRIDTVPVGDEAKLWLYGVARHTLADEIRKHQRQRRSTVDAPTHIALLADATPNPAELVELDETERALRLAINHLSPTDRELLHLVAWEELTPAEAATVLGIAPTTARVRLSRARRRLARTLQQPAVPEPARPVFDHP